MAAIMTVEEPFHRVRSEPAFSRTAVHGRRASVDTGFGSSRLSREAAGDLENSDGLSQVHWSLSPGLLH
jgi:hypothetical protein